MLLDVAGGGNAKAWCRELARSGSVSIGYRYVLVALCLAFFVAACAWAWWMIGTGRADFDDRRAAAVFVLVPLFITPMTAVIAGQLLRRGPAMTVSHTGVSARRSGVDAPWEHVLGADVIKHGSNRRFELWVTEEYWDDWSARGLRRLLPSGSRGRIGIGAIAADLDEVARFVHTEVKRRWRG